MGCTGSKGASAAAQQSPAKPADSAAPASAEQTATAPLPAATLLASPADKPAAAPAPAPAEAWMADAERIFKLADRNGDQYIDMSELAAVRKSDKYAEAMMGAQDQDADGRLTLEEWATYVRKMHSENPKSCTAVLKLYEKHLAELLNPLSPSTIDAPPAPLVREQETDAEKALKTIFVGIDADSNGTVSANELAAAFKRDDLDLAGLFAAAGMNSSFYVMEQLDANEDGRISWDEFRSSLFSAFGIRVGDAAFVPSTGATGRVVQRNTTDVELEMPDGSKAWHDIDDVTKAAPAAPATPAEAETAEELAQGAPVTDEAAEVPPQVGIASNAPAASCWSCSCAARAGPETEIEIKSGRNAKGRS